MAEKLEAGKNYSVEEAVSLISEFASSKFKESIDVAINLGVDPRKSDQVVRGSTLLPNGTVKDVRVAGSPWMSAACRRFLSGQLQE